MINIYLQTSTVCLPTPKNINFLTIIKILPIMSLNINLETLSQNCRVCLQKGELNIWHCKVSLKTGPDIEENVPSQEDSLEKSFWELMYIFYNSQDLVNLTEEFPLICWQCLEDLKCCYIFYEKLKVANIQLKNLYQESLNQCIEEEHLIEVIDEKDIEEVQEISETIIMPEYMEEEYNTNLSLNSNNEIAELPLINKTNESKNISLNKNDAFIITQFVATALEPSERVVQPPTKDEEEECPPQQLLTVNLKAVEIKDFTNLENLQSSSHINLNNTETAVYVCQYCPQAFAKSDYLKTHIHKSHVCKFCTQPFSITEELFKHIREVHTEHKCAICHKLLSSHTNLRHHIKRVHRIKLPAKVTLLDFIKSTSGEEIMPENQVEFLQEDLEGVNVDTSLQYIWKNDDCIQMFKENVNNEMD